MHCQAPIRAAHNDVQLVDFHITDAENPLNWSPWYKWILTAHLALTTFTVSFSSSAYTGGIKYTMHDLHISEEVAVLGISLYVLGFALGPLIFAPMGETFGRRIVFLTTFSAYTLLHLGGALAPNVATLLSTRLLAGIFGSSPLTNAGGSVSDIWSARDRGLASAIYCAVPFLGPIVGPIVGGFVSENPSMTWRWNFWLMMIMSAVTLILGIYLAPETYAPVLLRRRAAALQKQSGGVVKYTSVYDMKNDKKFSNVLRTNFSRPFVFLFTEPIVTLLSIYIAFVYGILYALFSAYPIVFQQHRHFSPGHGGLAFLGVGFGIILGIAATPIQNRIYWRAMDKSESGRAAPEHRLEMSIISAVIIPIGLFLFAWTSFPSIHYIVPVLAGVPFGAGVSQILQGLVSYLMDSYASHQVASAIAATILLRSLAGACFPLFAPLMFKALGDQLAMSVFAILSTICLPIPFLFYKYGSWLRSKSNFAYKDTLDSSSVNSGFCSRFDTLVEDGLDLEKTASTSTL